MPDDERHGLAYMYAHLDGSQMVGQYGYADGLSPSFNLAIDRCYQTLVQIFYGLELQVQVAVVTGLVAGLYVYSTLTMRKPA